MSATGGRLVTALAGVDTPTVCNALIVLDSSLRGKNYTLDPVVPADPAAPSFTGYAVTARIVSDEPPTESHEVLLARRFAYWRHLRQARRPSIVVMEDGGKHRGMGCIWGEIQVAIHQALGVVGAVTNGAIRDLGSLPAGFPLLGGNVCPGSGFAHLKGFDEPVTVFGLQVSPGDLIHADRHGCVVIPERLAASLPAAIERVASRERTLRAALATPGLDADTLEAAWKVFEIK